MTDKISIQRRSWNMSRIRSADTKPELLLRSVLHRMGFRFRLHNRVLPGRPDIILKKYRTVIFVHGCFWHQHPGCIDAVRPKSNIEYWSKKLDGNIKRDRDVRKKLLKEGWNVIRYWECEIKKDPVHVGLCIAKEILGDKYQEMNLNLPSRIELLKLTERRTHSKKMR